VVRPGLRGGKGEPLIRLRRRVADGVGPMRGGDPAHDPCLALLRRERVRKKKDDARRNQKREPPHSLSSRLLQPASKRPRPAADSCHWLKLRGRMLELRCRRHNDLDPDLFSQQGASEFRKWHLRFVPSCSKIDRRCASTVGRKPCKRRGISSVPRREG